MTTLQFTAGQLAAQCAQIPLGIRAENDVTRVELDFSAWAEEFGAGVVQLLIKRSGDASPYPVLLSQSGSTAVWTVSATDLAVRGPLEAEYLYTVGTTVKKSEVLRFYVLRDIGAPGSAPDPYTEWLEQLTGLAADTEAASQAIQDMDVEATTLAAGSAATVTKTVDPDTGAVTLTFGIPRGQDGGSAVDDEMAYLNGRTAFFPNVKTERVDGGTLIKNAVASKRCAAQLGFYLDTVEQKLNLFVFFSHSIDASDAASVKHYRLYEKDSTSDPYEFTLENAPTKGEVGSGQAYYKARQRVSGMEDGAVLDMRFCTVAYDANGNELRRIYSSQYRYTISDGVCTRTYVPTAMQDASYIVDIGLFANTDSGPKTYVRVSKSVFNRILPIVTTDETYQFEFIVPDEAFENTTYGLALAIVGGDGLTYLGPSFEKAVDTSPFVVTLTPTALDYSGTMDHTVAEIFAAYHAGRKIVFRLATDAATFIDADVSLVGTNTDFTYPSFESYAIQTFTNLLVWAGTGVTNDGSKTTYDTVIYALTPAT